jgi:hypothetical protein
MDYDPSLSTDGKTVIFVRRTLMPAGFEEPANPNPVNTQIWMANIDGTGKAKMVFAGPIILKGGSEYATFSKPRIAPDKRHAYFLIDLAVVETGLVRLDLASSQAEFVTAALDYYLIVRGRYVNDLVVQKRKLVEFGVTTFFWLFTPEGKELGFVGESAEEAQEFLRNPDRVLGKNPLVR